MLLTAENFLVDPGRGIIIWTVLAALALAAGVVTLPKGRVGWFFLGAVTWESSGLSVRS